jgi:hypothetical protein
MKILFALLLICLSLRVGAGTTGTITRTITLVWNYPSNEMSADLTFIMYHSPVMTNLLPWTVITNIVGTSTTCVVNLVPGENCLYVTASNFGLESPPSNILRFPPVAKFGIDLRALFSVLFWVGFTRWL